MVVAPARRQRALRGIPGQAKRFAPAGWYDINLLAAIVLPGKGDVLTIRRKLREQLQARVRRQLPRSTATGIGNPKVASVAEHHLIAV